MSETEEKCLLRKAAVITPLTLNVTLWILAINARVRLLQRIRSYRDAQE